MGSAGQRLSQHMRLFNIETVLGQDVFVVETMTGREGISTLFEYNLELASEKYGISPARLIGTPVKFGLRHLDEKTFRWMNGYVRDFRALPPTPRLARYAMTIVPKLWFLTKATDCNVRQRIKVPDRLRELFKKYEITDVDDSGLNKGKYLEWEYLTQYRESAFAFASRLMEIEGIFYFFRQEEGKHTLVLGDQQSVHKPCPYQSRFHVEKAKGRTKTRSEDYITNVEWRQEVRSGKYTHRDFNFQHPDPMQSDIPTLLGVGINEKLEIYDYPGEYEEDGEGRDWGKCRMEEEECGQEIIRCEGGARAVAAGFKFELTGADYRDLNKTYVVTEVEHFGQEGSLLSDDEPREAFYRNTFTAIPYDTPYRPARQTPKHIMKGVQTATVVGPKGEEIYTDPYGRIRVQFHWDREHQHNDDSSCWMRVAQPWAGKNFGALFIPRVGHEVIVDFIEGDPDRPIVTGCVYNERNRTPYKLPDKKNWSGIRSRSTKGGGVENFNEIRFDDTKGEELLWLHAEKDHRLTVEHDSTTVIDHDRFTTIKNNSTEQVKVNRHATVDGEERRETGKDLHEHVKGEHFEKVDKTRHTTIDGNWLANIGGAVAVTFGTGAEAKSGGMFKLHTSQGLTAQDDTNVLVKAGMQLTLQGPGGFISLGPSGVTIQGTMVYINSGGAAGSAASPPGQPDPTAPKQPATPPKLEKEVAHSDVDAQPPPPPARPQRQQKDLGSEGELARFEEVQPEEVQKGTPLAAAAAPAAAVAKASDKPKTESEEKAERAKTRAQFLADAKKAAPKVPYEQQPAFNAAVNRLERNNNAVEMARLSKAAYDDSGAPAGWKRLNDNVESMPASLRGLPWTDPQTGFRAAVFESEAPGPDGKKQTVLAFRGTAEGQDWTKANLPQGAGLGSSYHTNAIRIAQGMSDVYGDKMKVTGHSLGGGLAATAASVAGAKADTFNAAGVHQNTLAQVGQSTRDADGLVENYRVQGELLTAAQENVVSKYVVPVVGTAVVLPVKNALGLAKGLDPVAWFDYARGKGPMPKPELSADPVYVPAALGKQNDLPAVDAAGNPLPWTKDITGLDRHGIDYAIRGLEKQKDEDFRAIGAQLR